MSGSSGGTIPGRMEQFSLPIEVSFGDIPFRLVIDGPRAQSDDGSDGERSSYRTEIRVDDVSFFHDELSMVDEESYQVLDRSFCNPKMPEMLDHTMNGGSNFDLGAIMVRASS